MKAKTQSEKLETLVTEILEGSPFELVTCQLVKVGPDRALRIFIDHENGVTIDHCVTVTHLVRDRLAEEDPEGEDAFDIEVSSPGVDRPLVKPADFIRFQGERVTVKTYRPVDGVKSATGRLDRASDAGITIHDEERDRTIDFVYEDIAKATLKPILNFC